MNNFKITTITTIFFLVIWTGCKKNSKYILSNGFLLFHEYYDNGNLKKSSTFDLDSILNGEVLYYFENGQLARKAYYNNGKLFGMDSIFYKSGNINYHQQWYDSTLVHDTYSYYDSLVPYLVAVGNDTSIVKYPMLKTYRYFNNGGWSGFELEYSINGKDIRNGGDAIVSVYLDTLSNFDFTFIVASPPFFQGNFIIYVENLNKKMSLGSESLFIDAGKVNYHFDPENDIDDEYKITAVYKLLDNSRNLDFSDTVILDFKSRKFHMSRPNKPDDPILLFAAK